MNRLVRTVQRIKSQQVQYVNLVDELQKDWEDELEADGFNEIDDAERGHLILVPSKIWDNIKKLIDEHKAGRLRVSEADSLFFTTFLDYPDKERIPDNFLQEWKATRDWFVAHAHLREDEFEIDAPSKVERHFRTLDDLLYVAASSEFERISDIYEILEETNE